MTDSISASMDEESVSHYNFSRLTFDELEQEITGIEHDLANSPLTPHGVRVLTAKHTAAINERAMRLARAKVMQDRPLLATDLQALTSERGKTHGDWNEQARLASELKAVMRGSLNWYSLKPHQREALDMDAVKTSRILTGNPDEPDHWDDKAGYAFLGKGGHK